jgi:hypothetical protein
MLDIQGRQVTLSGPQVSRRDFVRVGALGIAGLTLADWLKLQARGEVKKQPKAKSVIQLWMGGGPPHMDTFDPKPDAGSEYTGPYHNPLQTNVPGIKICETLPLMAKQADKYSIIRSITHGDSGHETATYLMQTCTLPGELAYPAVGAVVAYKRYEAGYRGLPPYMSITSPLGRFTESGFLGTDYRVFATGGDPNSNTVRVEGLVPPSGVSDERLKDRRTLLQSVDSLAKGMEKNKRYEAMDSFQERAYAILLGDAKKAFEMSEEKAETRDRYGRNTFGQSCLLARRLVERGVPFITINSGGWDTHRDNFGRMKALCPPLDQGFSALLEDLAQRGLLDSTIVTWFGEFGRTPKIDPKPPWDNGRHHYGNAQSVVVAGGGFKGGHVVGSTDAKGEFPKDRTLYPWDLSASMYTLLGIDPQSRLPHPHGCVAYVTPSTGGELPTGGLLKEIM